MMDWLKEIYDQARTVFFKEAQDFIIEPLGIAHGAPFDGRPIDTDQEYVRITLKSARIVNVRVGTTYFYPCFHTRSTFLHTREGEVTLDAVVSPGKLEQLDKRNLDKVIAVDRVVAGPVPCHGSFSVEGGLFSIESVDLARPLLEVVTGLAEAAGVAFVGAAKQFLDPLQRGARLLLGTDSKARLEIGLDKGFAPPQTGYWLVMRATREQMPTEALRIDPNDWRVLANGKPLRGYPYFVLAVEGMRERDDWMKIPDLREAWNRIGAAHENGQQTEADARVKEFTWRCRSSPDLTLQDAKRLAQMAEQRFLDRQPSTRAIARARKRIPKLGSFESLDLYGRAAHR